MTIEEEILAKIVARYERAKKEDGSKSNLYGKQTINTKGKKGTA